MLIRSQEQNWALVDYRTHLFIDNSGAGFHADWESYKNLGLKKSTETFRWHNHSLTTFKNICSANDDVYALYLCNADPGSRMLKVFAQRQN